MTDTTRTDSPRSFGVSVGTLLCILALVLVWRGRIGRAETLGIVGVPLLVLGLTIPSVLRVPSAWWWRFSRGLGHVNARVLLTLMFALVFVPVSLVWRLTGKDPLARRRGRWPGWLPYAASRHDRGHYSRMF